MCDCVCLRIASPSAARQPPHAPRVCLLLHAQAAQAWAAAVAEVLATRGDWRRVGLRQMSGVLVLVFAR